MSAAILAMAFACAAHAPLTYRDRVVGAGAVVTFADIAELDRLPAELRRRAAGLEVARLPRPGQAEASAVRLSERARAQLPALAAWLPSEGRITLVRTADEPKTVSRPLACARLRTAIAGGDFVSGEELEPAACDARPARAFGVDRATGLARAAVDLPAGQLVIAPPSSSLARFKPGQQFVLSASVGVVRIERPVVAARPAREGAAVVIQDGEGRVQLAPPGEVQP